MKVWLMITITFFISYFIGVIVGYGVAKTVHTQIIKGYFRNDNDVSDNAQKSRSDFRHMQESEAQLRKEMKK